MDFRAAEVDAAHPAAGEPVGSGVQVAADRLRLRVPGAGAGVVVVDLGGGGVGVWLVGIAARVAVTGEVDLDRPVIGEQRLARVRKSEINLLGCEVPVELIGQGHLVGGAGDVGQFASA